MLRFLQIRNFAIVESLDLDFQSGFTAITGETGAGKSIMVGALSLLKGARADTTAIQAGADKAELSAEFELDDSSRASDWLRNADLRDDDSCLLRRLISRNGRSRAWINGTPVTLSQLEELGNLLIEIHGQNEHIRLVNREEQYRLLDGGGLHIRQQQDVGLAFESWQQLANEKEALLAESPLTSGESDLLLFQADELESNLVPADEFLRLEKEHRLLSQGSEILAALDFAGTEIDGAESNIVQRLTAVLSSITPHGELDPDISEAITLLNEAQINCQEASTAIGKAHSRMDVSPARLAEMERTLELQHDLARKHRVNPEQLAEVLVTLRDRLDRAANTDQRLVEIDEALKRALQHYRDAAQQLHTARASRAAQLAEAVTGFLQQLGMEGGRFEFLVREQAEASPHVNGTDELELKVSANPGTPPGPLRKVASGGELSRISLAIKVASKAHEPAHTQVFDEVDAGIGGDTANAVGALLRSLSVDGQALCVTHLAQVAVCADQQVQVLKSAEVDATRVSTMLLNESERIDEVARMLGGRLSDQSRAHASELLSSAKTRH